MKDTEYPTWNDLSTSDQLAAIQINDMHEDELRDGGFHFDEDLEIVEEHEVLDEDCESPFASPIYFR